jgi:hypothetical protein
MRKWIGVTAAAAAIVLFAALPAGAGVDGGFAPLDVHKVVVGPVPAGTQFVVTIDCDDDIIFTGIGNPVSSVQLVFDAQGNPVGTGDTVRFTGNGACTVTETQNGGAVSVVYECEGVTPTPAEASISGGGRFSARLGPGVPPPVCESSGPQSDPITVNIFNTEQHETVTVTNTFVTPPPSEPAASEPAPAAAVVGAPRFTG